MTIEKNSMLKSRIVSRTNSNPVLRFNCRIVIQNTNSNTDYKINYGLFSNLNKFHPYSQLNNWIIGQEPIKNPTKLSILGKAGKNKLEIIRCDDDQED